MILYFKFNFNDCKMYWYNVLNFFSIQQNNYLLIIKKQNFQDLKLKKICTYVNHIK